MNTTLHFPAQFPFSVTRTVNIFLASLRFRHLRVIPCSISAVDVAVGASSLVHIQSGRRFASADFLVRWTDLSCMRNDDRCCKMSLSISIMFGICRSAGRKGPGMHAVSCRCCDVCPVHFNHVWLLAFSQSSSKFLLKPGLGQSSTALCASTSPDNVRLLIFTIAVHSTSFYPHPHPPKQKQQQQQK